ncbi:MAG: O-antigen ligase family protein [Pseudomonadota bacterium]
MLDALRSRLLETGLLDRSLYVLVMAATFLGHRIAPIVALVLIASFILRLSTLRDDIRKLDTSLLWLGGTVGLMCLYFALMSTVHHQPYDNVHIFRPRGVEAPGEWLIFGSVSLLALLQFQQMEDIWAYHKKYFLQILGYALTIAVLVYVLGFWVVDQRVYACRSGLLTFNANVFAFLFAIVCSVGFASLLWSENDRPKAFIVLALSVFFLILITGSRMAILCFAVTNVLVALFVPGKRVLNMIFVLGLLTVVGGLAVLMTELLDCGLIQRLQRLSDATNPEVSNSTARRFELWGLAWDAVRNDLWFGIGPVHEGTLSYPNAHIHNQYLSWLVHGGLFGMLIGLAPIIGLLVYGWVQKGLVGFAVAGALAGFASLNFLSDSLVYWGDILPHFLVLIAFTAGLIKALPSASK